MPATATDLRELHLLHQRAKALRDRLASGPKTLASREKILANRQAALETARKTLKDLRAHARNREVQLQALQDKIADLRVKLNLTKKQVDYDAIRNQIAHDTAAVGHAEDDILNDLTRIDEESAALAAQEAEAATLAADVARLRADLEAQTPPMQAQLAELEATITAAEGVIPADQRDQYRRIVKQHGADALAPVEITDGQRRESGACSGCYVAVTPQMMSDLRLAGALVFCKTCGRLLYLPEEDVNHLRRTGA